MMIAQAHNEMVREVLARRKEESIRRKERGKARPKVRPEPSPRNEVDVARETVRRLSVQFADVAAPAAAPDAAVPEGAAEFGVSEYRKTVIAITREQEDEGLDEFGDEFVREHVLRFSPIMRVSVYENAETLEGQEWLKKEDIHRNKHLCRALQHRLGGKHRRDWIDGDEASLAAADGYVDVDAWLEEKCADSKKKPKKDRKKKKKKKKKRRKDLEPDADDDDDGA